MDLNRRQFSRWPPSALADLMKQHRNANFIEKSVQGEAVNRWRTTGFFSASAASSDTDCLTHKATR